MTVSPEMIERARVAVEMIWQHGDEKDIERYARTALEAVFEGKEQIEILKPGDWGCDTRCPFLKWSSVRGTVCTGGWGAWLKDKSQFAPGPNCPGPGSHILVPVI